MNQTFSELGLNPDRIAGLEAAGYESPSKLQCEVIPQLLAGHDLVVEAAPGSGKTVAFCLPILQTLNPDVQGVQALVLVPSGNDATRVAAQFQALGNPAERRVVPVFDEQPIAREAERLRQFVSVVVGTPERVREHLSRGSFNLEDLQVVIVDGVDELLVNNQQAVLDDLLEMTPAGRQTALFSGLLDAELQALADQYLFEPVLLKRLAGAVSMPVIKHRYQGLLTTDRVTALARLLDGENITRALIFANQRSSAEEVASALRVLGYGAEVIHGATSADAADAAVRNWREDFLDFLVLTDRGAGESALEADEVISFDMPTDAECYARRARLVAENGSLITLVSPRERRLLGEIESFTGQRVKAVLLTSRASAVVQRAEAFRQRVRDSLTHPAIETYLLLLNDLAEEGIDWADIAAAIATMTQQGGQSEPVFTPRRSSSSERRPSAPSARSSERREPAARPPREREREEDREVEAGYTRLIMDAGYDIGVRPKDIVGAIANEANIPGRAVGNIDIRDNFTYIEVQQDYIDRVLTRVPNTRLRGRVVSFRRA